MAGTKLRGKASNPAAPLVKAGSSIRRRIQNRVVPLVLIPMLLLAGATVAAVLFFERQTTAAVDDTESLLTEQVVEGAVTRTSARGSREVGEWVDGWIQTAEALGQRSDVRLRIADAAASLREAGVTEETPRQQALDTIGNRLYASTGALVAIQGTVAEDDVIPEITFISRDGYRLGSTKRESAIDYSNEIWFNDAMENGVHVRSFVIEGEIPASLEVTVRPSSSSVGEVGAIRMLIPLTPLLDIVDDLSFDDDVNVVLIDRESSVLLADTVNDNSEEFLYNMATLAGGRSGANLELLQEGTFTDALNLTSARPIETSVGPAQVNWLIQTQQPIERATQSLETIRDVQDELSESRRLFVFAIGGLLLLSLIVALLAIRALANRITAPLQQLSSQARHAADEGIPSVVEAAQSSADVLPELDPFEVESNDEIALLADSLNTMQDAATDLAAGQVRLRRQNVARTFVSLGRRNQNLLNRQLEFIDELEEQESDPETLENLFRLDHLATRMRRNAENLLVLAGEQTPRKWSRPIAVRDVVRAAASEIADYTRVQLGDIEPATVSGNVATDLSHLLAELLENAGNFSPPSTNIEVLGQKTATHYRMAIVDQGIGLDTEALEQANDRLQNPVDFADAPSAYLGLFVVGHLSRELGITVRLANADPTGEGRRSGTIAFVDMPVGLLTDAEATPVEAGSRRAVTDAARVEQRSSAPAPTPAPETAPAAASAPTVPPTPVQAPPSTETTAAGFPKRARRGEEAPVAPAEPAPAPTPAAELTTAGFPKRRSSNAPSPTSVSPAPAPAPTPPSDHGGAAPRRDAADVSSSLRSFREAVARGRAEAEQEGATGALHAIQPPQTAAPAPEPAPASTPLQPPPITPAPETPITADTPGGTQ